MNSGQIIKSCYWEITKKCNLKCLHCISSVGNKNEMDKGLALKTIGILDDWQCEEINFTGGEPLIRSDLFDIFKKAKEKKIKINLMTNGTLINNKNIYEIKNYVDNLGISIDGSSAEFNDRVRGKGSFKRMIKAINLVQKNRIPVTLYVTICKINLSDFDKILKLAKSLGVDNIRINEITLRGRAYKNRSQLKINNYQIGLKRYLLNILKESHYFEESFLFDSFCEFNKKNIFLSSSGYIYGCIEIYQKKPSRHLGNILKINKGFFKDQIRQQAKIKPKKCPYQLMVNNDFALCINNKLVKCKYGL